MSLNHMFMDNDNPQNVEVNDLKVDGTFTWSGLQSGNYDPEPTAPLANQAISSYTNTRYWKIGGLIGVAGYVIFDIQTAGQSKGEITINLPLGLSASPAHSFITLVGGENITQAVDMQTTSIQSNVVGNVVTIKFCKCDGGNWNSGTQMRLTYHGMVPV